MSVIMISNVAGKIPTVNQLLTTDSGMGYNRADGLFYALRINGNVKEVICIGASMNPADVHPRLHEINSSSDHAQVIEENLENTWQRIPKQGKLFSCPTLFRKGKNTLPHMPGNLAKCHCLTTTCFYA